MSMIETWRALWAWMMTTAATPSPLLTKDERGQTTAEYALVLLGVAAVALALTTWAGGGRIGSFLDAIFDRLLASAK